MLLVIDVGNTQTHIGTFRGDDLVEHWRFATVPESTTDQLGAALSDLLELRGLSFKDLRDSIVSSTVPQLAPEWLHVGERYLGHEMVVVGPGIKTGMPIKMDNPKELGADRLVNAVAAYDRFERACIVVDFGTAITCDAISADGEYLGGVIAPGVEISMEALTERAAKLPRIDLEEPRAVIGKSTVDALRSGVVYGFSGQVDNIVRLIQDELEADSDVIATGGLAESIAPHCETIDTVDDLLTLTGLRLIYELNGE